MKAVVMAGGEGSRLRPLTLNCPKPLVPVANKPVMHHILDLLKRHGIDEIIVTLHYLADQIQSTFADGSDLGLTIRYTIEETPLGTAGSVKQAERWLKDEPFLIVSGDALTDADLTRFVQFHAEQKSDATLGLIKRANPLEYGVVVTDGDGRIRRFLEKPDWTEAFSNTVNTGIYCLSPLVFEYMEPAKSYDWSHDIFPRLLSEGKNLYGTLLDGYWSDIGSVQTYREAQLDALTGKVVLDLPGEAIESGIWLGEGARIDPGAWIGEPALIGAGAHIKEGARVDEGSVIGDFCVVEPSAHVSGSTIWNGVYIGEGARIDGAIVARNSSLGRMSRLEEGVMIGERCQIHPGSSLAPDVKVWPNKIVEAGVRLNMSLITGSKWSGSLFTGGTVLGVPNAEITPELASNLASAYGSLLPLGSTVVVGRDGHPVCRTIKPALIAGLMSSGVNVLDVHATPLPISRYLTGISAAHGGLHIHMCACLPRLVSIDFFDADGVPLSAAARRRIETLFGWGDYRRVSLTEIGEIHAVKEAGEQYRQGVRRGVNEALLRDRCARIVLDCAFGTVSSIAPSLMGDIGCRPVAVNAFPDSSAEPRTATEKMQLLEDLSAMVPSLGAELGALLTDDATTLHLVDDRGRVLTEPILMLAFADVIFRTEPGAVIAVPIAAPSQLEAMAEKVGGRVVRTRSSERELIASARGAKAAMGGDLSGHLVLPGAHPAFDGIVALIEILQRLSKLQMRLSEVVDALPPLYLQHALVPCSWERKGEIIRRLGEEVANADLSEGVWLRYDDEWVHILPDATMPAFHVHAQAGSRQRLETLMNQYQSRLEALGAN